MGRFLTPAEMFQEYIEEQNAKEDRYENYVDSEMQSYAKEALNRMKCEIKIELMAMEYLVSVAEAYVEDNKSAVKIFDRLGLKPLHAYATLEKYHWFKEEMERMNEYSPDFDDCDDEQVYEA